METKLHVENSKLFSGKCFIFLKDFTPINAMAVDNVICFTLDALLFCVLSDLTIV